MISVQREHLRFASSPEGAKGLYYNYFEFDLLREELERIAPFRVEGGALLFEGDENRVTRRAHQLLDWKLASLRSRISRNPTLYVDQASGIPLIGSLSFGLIDRNSTCVEVRPNTGCNLRCVYCSVGEGLNTFNKGEYLVDADYLVEGLAELISFKGCAVDVHIGSQGEPTLYARLEELLRKIRALDVRTISLVSNGVLLSPERVAALADAGLDRLDLSLNALTPEKAKEVAGCRYDLEHVKRVAEATKSRMELLIAPVWIPGLNDAEMGPLIEFAKSLGARIGIQNYLPYRFGRNPTKPMPMDSFLEQLRELEKRHACKLLLGPEDFDIRPTKPLPKPFRRGDVVEAEVIGMGRHAGERLATAQGRVITVTGCRKDGIIRVRLTRSKHNIFYGRAMGPG